MGFEPSMPVSTEYELGVVTITPRSRLMLNIPSSQYISCMLFSLKPSLLTLAYTNEKPFNYKTSVVSTVPYIMSRT